MSDDLTDRARELAERIAPIYCYPLDYSGVDQVADLIAAALQRVRDEAHEAGSSRIVYMSLKQRDYYERQEARAEKAEEENNALVTRLKIAENDARALREALTPSADTKATYIGEFGHPVKAYDEDGEEITFPATVPWTTIKEIMAAILARATLAVSAKNDLLQAPNTEDRA
jgi:hypothetical protein